MDNRDLPELVSLEKREARLRIAREVFDQGPTAIANYLVIGEAIAKLSHALREDYWAAYAPFDPDNPDKGLAASQHLLSVIRDYGRIILHALTGEDPANVS